MSFIRQHKVPPVKISVDIAYIPVIMYLTLEIEGMKMGTFISDKPTASAELIRNTIRVTTENMTLRMTLQMRKDLRGIFFKEAINVVFLPRTFDGLTGQRTFIDMIPDMPKDQLESVTSSIDAYVKVWVDMHPKS